MTSISDADACWRVRQKVHSGFAVGADFLKNRRFLSSPFQPEQERWDQNYCAFSPRWPPPSSPTSLSSSENGVCLSQLFISCLVCCCSHLRAFFLPCGILNAWVEGPYGILFRIHLVAHIYTYKCMTGVFSTGRTAFSYIFTTCFFMWDV